MYFLFMQIPNIIVSLISAGHVVMYLPCLQVRTTTVSTDPDPDPVPPPAPAGSIGLFY